MANNIVTLNVTQTVAPAASTLQQTGAFISQGGTTNAVNSLTLLTVSSSLTSMLTTPLALTALTWSGGTVTATTAVVHGLTNAQVYYLTISGALPAGYNGTYACTITGNTTFTYALVSNPGTSTSPGTWVPSSQTQLQQMNTTFWAQGSSVPVYVLELGTGSVNAGVTALTTWIANNALTVYLFLIPREWDANASFIALCANNASTTSKMYFLVTTTNSTYTSYSTPVPIKSVYALVEAPTLLTGEFSLASNMWQMLEYNPSPTNQVTPLAFSYVFGVSPYPRVGNTTIFANWQSAGVNRIGTGYEGGISNSIIFWGSMMDLNPFNYWYAADWLQLNIDLNMSNAVINGSNNPQAPLYLNQNGINRLQAVGASTLTSAITFGLLVGQVVQTELNGAAYATALAQGTYAGQAVINAVPFAAYYSVNPSQYATGTYNGFACTVTPLRGFQSITFYINLTNIVATQ